MADKYYLDEEGLKRLVQYINAQFKTNKDAIELLNKTDGTPGSIQQMIDDAISEIDIADLQQDEQIILYGGSASKLVNEEV